MVLPAPPRSDREAFHHFCRRYLLTRKHGGYISSEASRMLRKYVLAYIETIPRPSPHIDIVTRHVLDKFPVRRIDRKVLEKFKIVPRKVNPKLYPASAPGHEYRYKSLMGERMIAGEMKVLVEWEPTWEPIANVRSEDLRRKHDQARSERRRAREE